MKTTQVMAWLAATAMGVLGTIGDAAAGVPAWCKGQTFDANSTDLNDLKHSDPRYVVGAIVKTLCSTSSEVTQYQPKIDQARQAWSKKLAMSDADWSDAVEDAQRRSYESPTMSTTNMAAMTPIDQYLTIREGFPGKWDDPIYAADVFGAKLTEVGRLGLLEECLNERVEHSSMGRLAVCHGDFDAWDHAKFGAQLRTSTAHGGAHRMNLRYKALEVMDALKTYAAERDKLFGRDETYKQVYAAAAKGRAAWASGVGKDQALLDLVFTMDAAAVTGSRKQFGDCKETTAAALAKAVGKLPAKRFEGMQDERMDPFNGFAYKAAPVLAADPEVNLAATAYALCNPETHTSGYLAQAVSVVPGFRGPRAAAQTEILNTKFEFDDVNARPLPVPGLRGRPVDKIQGSTSSAGGVVATVKPGKDHAVVALKKTKVKRHQCLQSKSTNRVSRIRNDGSLEYEAYCVKSGVVTVDTTWADFRIRLEFVPVLKPGVMFTVVGANTAQDVLAVWSKADAKAPSWLLGAKLK